MVLVFWVKYDQVNPFTKFTTKFYKYGFDIGLFIWIRNSRSSRIEKLIPNWRLGIDGPSAVQTSVIGILQTSVIWILQKSVIWILQKFVIWILQTPVIWVIQKSVTCISNSVESQLESQLDSPRRRRQPPSPSGACRRWPRPGSDTISASPRTVAPPARCT